MIPALFCCSDSHGQARDTTTQQLARTVTYKIVHVCTDSTPHHLLLHTYLCVTAVTQYLINTRYIVVASLYLSGHCLAFFVLSVASQQQSRASFLFRTASAHFHRSVRWASRGRGITRGKPLPLFFPPPTLVYIHNLPSFLSRDGFGRTAVSYLPSSTF